MINGNHREEKKLIEIQKAYEKFFKNEYREIAHDIYYRRKELKYPLLPN